MKLAGLFAIFYLYSTTAQSQSLSVGVYIDYSNLNYEIMSKSIDPTINGLSVYETTYTQDDIDNLNNYHLHYRKFNTFGLQSSYSFKHADSSKFKFDVGLGIGLGIYEHRRYANYDGTVYYAWSGDQFIATTENIDFNFNLSTSASFFFTPNISLKGMLFSNYYYFETSNIDDVTMSYSDDYEDSYRYYSKTLNSSFNLLIGYNVDGFEIFIGPRFYYNYQWTEYVIKKIDIDDNVEYSELIYCTYKGKSLVMLTGGMNYTINHKVGIGIQLAGNKNNLNVSGQINYYFNKKN